MHKSRFIIAYVSILEFKNKNLSLSLSKFDMQIVKHIFFVCM